MRDLCQQTLCPHPLDAGGVDKPPFDEAEAIHGPACRIKLDLSTAESHRYLFEVSADGPSRRRVDGLLRRGDHNTTAPRPALATASLGRGPCWHERAWR